MISVLWSPLCTWYDKWDERPPKVIKRSKR